MKKYITNIEKLQEKELPAWVEWKYKKMVRSRDVIDVTYMSYKPEVHIKKISKSEYLTGYYSKNGEFYSDGEVFNVAIKENQFRNRRSLRKIFVDLRQLIYHNFDGSDCELFLTLTYAEQTNDHKQIHDDFRKFFQRLKRQWNGCLEYISIVEPHESGNYHIHVLLRSYRNPNPWDGRTMEDVGRELYNVWGLGYVLAEQLDCDNIGAYFVAYFSNMELSDEQAVKYKDDVVEKNGKKYIKGKRLDFYPDYMKIYRSSRGILKPQQGDFDLDGYNRKYNQITALERSDGGRYYIKQEQYKE